jgi:hypothetical protein
MTSFFAANSRFATHFGFIHRIDKVETRFALQSARPPLATQLRQTAAVTSTALCRTSARRCAGDAVGVSLEISNPVSG